MAGLGFTETTKLNEEATVPGITSVMLVLGAFANKRQSRSKPNILITLQ